MKHKLTQQDVDKMKAEKEKTIQTIKGKDTGNRI